MEDTRALLAELVAIDSVNPRLVPGGAGEAEVARFVGGWMEARGLEVDVSDAEPGRPNAVGRARGRGGGRPPLLNAHKDDHLVLEFARRGYDDLAVFNDLDPKIGRAVGVIDIKDNEIEAPDLVASRIETIVKTVGDQRVRYVNPDCGFWMLQRSVVDRKLRALVEGRNLFEGKL